MVIPRHLVSTDVIVPKLALFPGAPLEEMIPIGLPAREFRAFGEKLTRGSVYVMDDGRRIESRKSITVLQPMSEEVSAAKVINQLISARGVEHNLGPGFRIGRGRGWMQSEESQLQYPAEFFRFEVCGRLVIYPRLLS